MSGDLANLVNRLEAVTARLERVSSRGGGGGGADAGNSEIVEEFDSQVLGGKLKTYFELSAKIGGEVQEHAALVKATFQTQREFIVAVSKHKAPPPDVFQKATAPIAKRVDEVQAFCDKRRGSKMSNHLMAVKEGIGCVGWVTVSPKPANYVKEIKDQAMFYSNRVLKDYKGKEEVHVKWTQAFTGAIMELQEYVKTFHTPGLAWNPDGPVLTGAPSGPPAPPPAGPAPPPPPPIQPPTDAPPPKADAQTSMRANLFAQINTGGKVTQGLRKVTNDMKTHKNPELRASSVVKATDVKPAPAKKFGSAAAPVTKPPVCELQGKKWIVEYQQDNPNISITDTNVKQAVYVFRCQKSTIKVSGKVNSIIIDSCKKVGLCFDDVISSVEIINSQSVQVQVTGKCPTVSIDKTDGCQVFLSEASLKAEIITAKSSEMNICIPKGRSGDYAEHAMPEQFKTTWDGQRLVTVCSDI